ncbi:hypothetical protein [Pelagicoccus albus]|uniref:Uncharacterized protein n=1 Tax=Pelagicoccus albus TaxID=415222 RepID=A0A7X1E8U5_9BACT|nr:hypothetical protein [Pelagicoccus albus]MBC2606498.1 hypothetical protein [Pelagicoccus albus]
MPPKDEISFDMPDVSSKDSIPAFRYSSSGAVHEDQELQNAVQHKLDEIKRITEERKKEREFQARKGEIYLTTRSVFARALCAVVASYLYFLPDGFGMKLFGILLFFGILEGVRKISPNIKPPTEMRETIENYVAIFFSLAIPYTFLGSEDQERIGIAFLVRQLELLWEYLLG